MNEHKLDEEKTSCIKCGLVAFLFEEEPCEPEDLSMWCGPGQSVSSMLKNAADKD